MAERNKNPKNPTSQLFKRLTRLFSGPLVNYRAQAARREKRLDLDNKCGKRFTSASGKKFKRATYDPFAQLLTQPHGKPSQGRTLR